MPTSESRTRMRMNCTTSTERPAPRRYPTTMVTTNSQATPPTLSISPPMTATNTLNSVSEAASLMRLSPESTVMTRAAAARAVGRSPRPRRRRAARRSRTKQQCTRQGQRRHQQVGNSTHRERRDDHEPDAEPPDLPGALFEVLVRHVERGRVQQGRQNDRENDLGVDLDARHARDERHQRARPPTTSSGAGHPRQRANALTASDPARMMSSSPVSMSSSPYGKGPGFRAPGLAVQ